MVNVSLEQLELITEVLFNPQGNLSKKEEAEKISLLYESTPSCYKELFEYFVKTKKDICQFWILQTLINLTNKYYNNYTPEDRANIRAALLNIISFYLSQYQIKAHVVNKFCQYYLVWIKFDFPENNKNAFLDLMKLIETASNDNIKLNIMSKYYMFIII
jgi:hypothetical protein